MISPQKVEDSLTVVRYTDILMSAVYLGDLTSLVNVTDKAKWRINKDESEDFPYGDIEELTLKEIADQFATNKHQTITVIVDQPKDTDVYQYNNYGDGCWYSLGSLCGFC